MFYLIINCYYWSGGTFTSKFFYNGEITNDISVETRELPDYLMNVISKEKNFIFFNTNGI